MGDEAVLGDLAMTGIDLIALLADAAKSAVAGYISRKAQAGVGSILEWIDKSASGQITATDRKNLENLLSENPSTYQWLRSFLAKDRHGIMLVGPSGAGKTHLMASLTQTVRQSDQISTIEITEASAFFNGRLVVVRDTPGKPEHGADLWEALGQYQPSVLVLVVAFGFLSPVGTGTQFWLGGAHHTKRRKLDTFLKEARKSEIDSIKEFTRLVSVPKTKVKHLVVVVNKMDIWLKQHAEAMTYYQENEEFQAAVRSLLHKVGRPGQVAQTVTASAAYDSFKTISPDGQFSREASTDSVRLLKGLLAVLLTDGNIT